MDKRYQVFVSSTFDDLRVERLRVVQALLESDCIPVCMEFFPAANDSAWDFIRRIIEESDYYVVIVGGRYGSMTAEGVSYTQKEYEYAVSRGIPVAAFLHANPDKIPAGKTELDKESRTKLEIFRELCRKKLCRSWNNADDLAGHVVLGINQLKKSNPAVGWIKSDRAEVESAGEILRLKRRINDLESQVSAVEFDLVEESSLIASGDDRFEIPIKIVHTIRKGSVEYERQDGRVVPQPLYKAGEYSNQDVVLNLTWNDITLLVGGILFASGRMIYQDLQTTFSLNLKHKYGKNLLGDRFNTFDEFIVDDVAFFRILIQLNALGLISREKVDTAVMAGLSDRQVWILTTLGEKVYVRNEALKRS